MIKRYIGYSLLLLGLILGYIFYALEKSLKEIAQLACEGVEDCSVQIFGIESILVYAIVIIFWAFGIYLIFNEKNQNSPLTDYNQKKEIQSKLSPDEKLVYDMIIENSNQIYQSEIVKNTQYSKVKITRILDKLEYKNLIERKRKGMTNIVTIKEEKPQEKIEDT